MGGHQVPGMGSGDDGYDEEGYDESQRAEILEATRSGPTDGAILTDLEPDLGDDPDAEPLDDIDMDAETIGESDASVAMSDEDIDEDDVQADLDEDRIGGGVDADGDAELDDADDVALKP